MRQGTILLLAALVIAAPSRLGLARSHDVTHRASLRCGGTLFTMMTVEDGISAGALRQILLAHVPGRGATNVDLRESEATDREAIHHHSAFVGRFAATRLADEVELWRCHPEATIPVLELLYSCNLLVDDIVRHRLCPDGGEWVRYIGPDGRPLDAGYATEDPRYGALRRTLNLATGDREERMIDAR